MRVRRRKRRSLHRSPVPQAAGRNQHSSMDFVHDQLVDGRRFRVLTVINQCSRERVLLEAGFTLTRQSVAAALERVAVNPWSATGHGSDRILVSNCPESGTSSKLCVYSKRTAMPAGMSVWFTTIAGSSDSMHGVRWGNTLNSKGFLQVVFHGSNKSVVGNLYTCRNTLRPAP
jgi:hypothetical protein